MAQAKLKRPVAPAAEENFLRDPQIPLTLEDRSALREMFQSQAFKRAWHNAEFLKPSVFPSVDPVVGGLNGTQGAVVANNRLHEIRGWEMMKAALIKQLADPIPKVPRMQDTFPDSGVEIVDPSTLPKSPGPAPLPLHPKPTPNP